MTKDKKIILLELGELARKINEHNRRYYIDDKPTISDAEYDKLFDRLLAIERVHPDFIALDSPSQRVGATPPGRSRRFRIPSSNRKNDPKPPIMPLIAGNTRGSRRM